MFSHLVRGHLLTRSGGLLEDSQFGLSLTLEVLAISEYLTSLHQRCWLLETLVEPLAADLQPVLHVAQTLGQPFSSWAIESKMTILGT